MRVYIEDIVVKSSSKDNVPYVEEDEETKKLYSFLEMNKDGEDFAHCHLVR